MMQVDLDSPLLAAVGAVDAPPQVELPTPVFLTWDAAETYARAALLRMRYVASQLPAGEDAVGAAQIAVAALHEELRLLQIAAAELLNQGVQLA